MRRRYALALAACLALSGPTLSEAAAEDLSALAFQPHPGAPLPLALPLEDETGRAVTLANYFIGKPVVLVLDYLRCKTLCGLTLANVIAALEAVPLAAGRDYQMLAISIDPRDQPADAAAAKQKYLSGDRRAEDAAGMHFLTGPASAVQSLAEAVGFPYRYDPATDQFIHPAGFVIAAPDGRISRYVFGIGPSTAELEAGLADAARGITLDPLTRLLLLCHADGLPLGRYTLPIEAAFAAANLAALLSLIAVFASIRRRRRG